MCVDVSTRQILCFQENCQMYSRVRRDNTRLLDNELQRVIDNDCIVWDANILTSPICYELSIIMAK